MVKSVVIFGAETAVGLAAAKDLAAVRLGLLGESSAAVIATIKALVPSLKGEAARALAAVEGVTPVQVPMDGHHTHALARALEGASDVFVVTPMDASGADVAALVIGAAAAAGATSLVVTSLTVAGHTALRYGAQFGAVEAAARGSGIPQVTVVRTTLGAASLDGFVAHRTTIHEHGVVHGAVGPACRFTPCLAADAGRAVAAILRAPAAHAGKTYNLHAAAPTSMAEFVGALVAQMGGGGLRYEQLPRGMVYKGMVRGGASRWAAEAELELWDVLNATTEGGGSGGAAVPQGVGGVSEAAEAALLAAGSPGALGTAMNVIAGWSPRVVAAGEQFADVLMLTGVDAQSVPEWLAGNLDSFR
jgi:NAD(P)H dehydrogenase (quinone)